MCDSFPHLLPPLFRLTLTHAPVNVCLGKRVKTVQLHTSSVRRGWFGAANPSRGVQTPGGDGNGKGLEQNVWDALGDAPGGLQGALEKACPPRHTPRQAGLGEGDGPCLPGGMQRRVLHGDTEPLTEPKLLSKNLLKRIAQQNLKPGHKKHNSY